MKKLIILLISLLLFSNIAVFADTKDETIYITLGDNGTVESSIVISHLAKDQAATFFEDLSLGTEKNLSTGHVLQYENNQFSVELDQATHDFYYETEYEDILPFTYHFDYFLDGEKIDSNALAGQSGEVEIIIDVTTVDTRFSDYLMSQTTVTLDLEKVTQVESSASSEVITGTTQTLNFITLPNTNDQYTMKFITKDFEMESIMIALLPSTIGLPDSYLTQFEDMKNGFGDMSKGLKDMSEGSVELQEGLTVFYDGLKTFETNFKFLNTETSKLLNGTKNLLEGYQTFAAGIAPLYDASTQIDSGLKQITTESANFKYGLQQSNQGLSTLNDGHESLAQLAELLKDNSDPLVAQLAQGILEEQTAINELHQGNMALEQGYTALQGSLVTLSDTYSTFDVGIKDMINNTAQLNTGNIELTKGITPTINGLSKLYEGSATMVSEFEIIPGSLEPMIHGQVTMAEGLDETIEQIVTQMNDASEAITINSFIHENQEIDSLQILLKTSAIVVEEIQIFPEEVVENKSFIDKLIDLFK